MRRAAQETEDLVVHIHSASLLELGLSDCCLLEGFFGGFQELTFRVCEERAHLTFICTMRNMRQTLLFLRKTRSLHTVSNETASESLKRKVADFQKRKKKRNLKKNEVFVEVPESRAFLDTASTPMILTAVGVALFAKLLMMYDESKSQEMIERKIKNAPPGQGTVRMLTREEWEEIREVRPRTPFESKLARPNARIRTGDAMKKEDVKDWAIDVFMDAVTRVEESLRHNSR